MYRTLIDSQALSRHMDDPNWVIVDCRFNLADTDAGQQAYEQSHIPGAVYAHLDEDLSGPPVTDRGRHPLPTPAAMTTLFGRLGIDGSKQVVVYDDANGAYAARLWWMLRYMGHEAVAVLDGGWQAWQEAGLPTRSGVEINPTTLFTGAPRTEWLMQIEDVAQQAAQQAAQQVLLVDSRAPERYRGEVEPLDPVAGHIPGAVNYPYEQNWGEGGRYLPPEQIRKQLQEVLGDVPPEQATFYCGSGVSACANLLAMAHAGLRDGRLYVGSWSEWSRDPQREVATG
ncbi:MAG TPA: sulfurtransferase [Anaerolineae bacterium]